MILKLGDKFQEKFILANEIYQGFMEIFKDKNPLHTNHLFAD